MYINNQDRIKQAFMNKQKPNIAQALARTEIGNNLVQQAQHTNSPWANLIANALNTGFNVYNNVKTGRQEDIAEQEANNYNNTMKDLYEKGNYNALAANAASIGDFDSALKYSSMGENVLKRQEDKQLKERQLDLEERSVNEEINKNRENNILARQKIELESQLSPIDISAIEARRLTQLRFENEKFDKFERTVSGKELAKSRNEAVSFQNTARSLRNRIEELEDLKGNITNSTLGRAIDKLASRFGITTNGSLKLDDLRSVQQQIMNEMRQTLRGQGNITDQEARDLPNIFIFTSDGRIVNNIENFKKYLDNVERRKINTYNDLYNVNKPRIDNQGLNDYYDKMEIPEYLQNRQNVNEQPFVLKKNKKTGEVYKVFQDGSYELQQ